MTLFVILSVTVLIVTHTTFVYLSSSHFALAQNSATQNVTRYIPTTISKEAQEELQKITFDPSLMRSPDPNDLDGWKMQYDSFESISEELSQPIVDLYQPNITNVTLGGLYVLDIRPKNWNDNGKVLVYTHGGAYTFGSTNSTLGAPSLVANETGLRVISVNYTVAPFSKWNQTTNEVISVIQALMEQGYSLEDDIAMFGESAGGGLVAGSVLKMRDRGLGMPSSVVLWSPWLDLTGRGDTYITLKNEDLFLSYDSFLENASGAYAAPADQKNPYVSPVYGNFSKGFPPALIQGGTREIFLSDFVRLYQALDQANIPVKLDIYEGMPHVHQFLYKTPESKIALSKMNNFLQAYLNK